MDRCENDAWHSRHFQTNIAHVAITAPNAILKKQKQKQKQMQFLNNTTLLPQGNKVMLGRTLRYVLPCAFCLSLTECGLPSKFGIIFNTAPDGVPEVLSDVTSEAIQLCAEPNSGIAGGDSV